MRFLHEALDDSRKFAPGRVRSGAALAAVLLLLVVLDCIVLGTLHISLQEHRIGANRQSALQLRLDAESALRAALGSWTPALDSMAAATPRTFPAHGIDRTTVTAERLGENLYLLHAVALEAAPRAGRAAARLLVKPPPLPPDIDPAPAALSVRGPVHILPTGRVSTAVRICGRPSPVYSVRATDVDALRVDPGGLLDAPPGPLAERSLTAILDRLASLAAQGPGLRLVTGDTILGEPAAGAWIVQGSLIMAPGAAFEGLLVVRGNLSLEPGSVVGGAAHVGGAAIIGGELRADPCLVGTAVDAAGLRAAEPAGRRAWIPAFGW